MRSADIWLFRLVAAGVTFAAVFFGGRYAGRYLHEQYALERAHRECTEQQAIDDARELARGYSDTQGFKDVTQRLTVEEINSAYAEPHPLEKDSTKYGAIAAVVMAILVGESARIWATKRAAQRRLSGKR